MREPSVNAGPDGRSSAAPGTAAAGARGCTRREFGAILAGATAAATATWVGTGCGHAGNPDGSTPLPALRGGASGVVVSGVRRGDADTVRDRAVRRAAEAATDFGWLSRGDTVLVKVASNSAYAYPSTTDPVAVRAVVALLRERGAGRVIVGDMSGVQFLRFGPDATSGSTRAILEENGIAAAARDAGAEVRAFEEAGWDGFAPVTAPTGGHWRGPLWLPALLDEVDHVVLLPRCGRHILAGSTLGLKCAVGWWRHDTRLEYHRDAAGFAQRTAEANAAPAIADKLRLVLTSATRVLSTFGPDWGRVVEPETGLVIASSDLVGHDMVSLAWLLRQRATLTPAEREGLVDDPNGSPAFVDFSNRIVTGWLGGMRAALGAERLHPWRLQGVFDDRVLRRAFEIGGGVPALELTAADAVVPHADRAALLRACTPPEVTA